MAKIRTQQHSFVAGVMSPEMFGRTDFPRYYAGMSVGRNILVSPTGVVRKRPGTRLEYQLGASSVDPTQRFIPFEFSVTDAYALLFSNGSSTADRGLIHVHRAGVGAVTVEGGSSGVAANFAASLDGYADNSTGTATVTHDAAAERMSLNVTNGNTAIATKQVTASETTKKQLLVFSIYGHAGDGGHAYESNGETPGLTLKLGRTGAGSTEYINQHYNVGHHAITFTPTIAQLDIQWECSYDPTGGTYTLQLDDIDGIPQSSDRVAVGSPWRSTTSGQEPENLRFSQVADVLYLFNSGTTPMQLKRLAHDRWSLEPVPWIDGPYLDANDTTTTIGSAATTGRRVAFTASAVTGINNGDGFRASDVGRLLRKADAATPTSWGYAIITEITSTTVVQCDIIGTMPNTTAVTAWQLGAWNSEDGWPQVVGQHEQRLVVGRTTGLPTHVWATAAAGFTDYTPGTGAADAVTFDVQAGGQNAIQWLKGIGDVLLGTAADEILMQQASDQTFSEASPVKQTSAGSDAIDAVTIGGVALFIQRTGRRLRELAYRFEQGADGGYRSADLSALSDHLMNAGLEATAARRAKELHYQPERDPTIWVLLDDGVALAVTYDREQNVVAWSEALYFRDGSDGTQDTVESMCVVPVAGGYELWLVCHRNMTSDGGSSDSVFIERIVFGWTDKEDAWYADAALAYDGAATSTLTGFTHFDTGDECAIWGDGALHPKKAVTSPSELLLDRDVTKAIAGLPYQPVITSMPLAQPDAPLSDVMKSYGRVAVRLRDSQGVRVGGKRIPARSGGDEFTTSPPLRAGLFKVPVDGWNEELTFTIDQDEFSAAPMTVLSYSAPVEVSSE